MRTTNYETAGSRAISNAKLLCGLLDNNTSFIVGEDTSTSVNNKGAEVGLSDMETKMTLLVEETLKVLAVACLKESEKEISKEYFVERVKNNELKIFIQKCCKDRVFEEFYSIGDGSSQVENNNKCLFINKNILNSEIEFMIDRTSPYFRRVVGDLFTNSINPEGTNLFRAYKIAQLNRIICVAAEEFVEKGKIFSIENRVFSLFKKSKNPIGSLIGEAYEAEMEKIKTEIVNNFENIKGFKSSQFSNKINKLITCDAAQFESSFKELKSFFNTPFGDNLGSFKMRKFHGNWLFYIWHRAQCARSGTFKNPCNHNDNNFAKKSVNELIEIFKKKQEDPECPFNKEIHRRRSKSKDQNERYLLSIGAGAGITRVDEDSTLGFVQRALHLPERCDISGTTTDAVGLAKAVTDGTIKIGVLDLKNHINPSVYVLCCITSMCLQGHHSLDEMGAAISLSVDKGDQTLTKEDLSKDLSKDFSVGKFLKESKQNTYFRNEKNKKVKKNKTVAVLTIGKYSGKYNPLRVFSIVDLLERIGSKEYNKNLKLRDLSHTDWLSSEWLALSDQYKTNDWEFSHDNWKKWKAVKGKLDPKALAWITGYKEGKLLEVMYTELKKPDSDTSGTN